MQPEPPSSVNSCVVVFFIACLIFVCLTRVPAFQQPALVLDLFEETPTLLPPFPTPEAIRVLNLIMASMTGPYLCDRDFKGLAGLIYSTPQFFLTALHGPWKTHKKRGLPQPPRKRENNRIKTILQK